MLGLILLSLAGSAVAVGRAELDNRIGRLTAKFEALQQDPAKSIPAESLRKANCIVLLHRTKAGVLFAYQGGAGVAMVKDAKSGQWGPAAFLKADEGSLGFQIGGQQSFIVILFTETNFPAWLSEQNQRFGGEARGTAGDATTGVEVEAAPQEAPVLVFDSRQGLYGGAAVRGGSITEDTSANIAYYGQPLSTSDVLFGGKVKHTRATLALAERISVSSRPAKN